MQGVRVPGLFRGWIDLTRRENNPRAVRSKAKNEDTQQEALPEPHLDLPTLPARPYERYLEGDWIPTRFSANPASALLPFPTENITRVRILVLSHNQLIAEQQFCSIPLPEISYLRTLARTGFLERRMQMHSTIRRHHGSF
jgi:hypothetical protein